MAKKPVVKMVPKPAVKFQGKTEKELCLEAIQKALVDFDGESNIPIDHAYWKNLTKYRSL